MEARNLGISRFSQSDSTNMSRVDDTVMTGDLRVPRGWTAITTSYNVAQATRSAPLNLLGTYTGGDANLRRGLSVIENL